MNTNIDIGRLAKHFSQAENVNSNPIIVCEYLNNEVLKPLLLGECVCTSDIDFSSFSIEELENLRLFLEHSSDISSRLHGLCGLISRIKPRAISAPSYC